MKTYKTPKAYLRFGPARPWVQEAFGTCSWDFNVAQEVTWRKTCLWRIRLAPDEQQYPTCNAMWNDVRSGVGIWLHTVKGWLLLTHGATDGHTSHQPYACINNVLSEASIVLCCYGEAVAKTQSWGHKVPKAMRVNNTVYSRLSKTHLYMFESKEA